MPQEGRKIGFRGEANPPEKKSDVPKRRTRIGFDAMPAGQHVSLEEEQKKFSEQWTQEQKREIDLLINTLKEKVFQKHREVLAELAETEKSHRAHDRGRDIGWVLLAENALDAFQRKMEQAVKRLDSEEISKETKETLEHDLRNFAAEAKQSYGFILDLIQERQ